MSKTNTRNNQWHRPRDTLETDKGFRRRNRSRNWLDRAAEHSGFWVPGVSVRRPVVRDEDYDEFVDSLNEVLGRNFRVISPYQRAVTILEERKFIDAFRQAGYQLDEEEARDLVQVLSSDMGEQLKGGTVARKVEFPVGQVAVFGDEHNVVGLEMAGWDGHKDKYHPSTFSYRFFQESAVTLGAISRMFGGGGVAARPLENKTPHISLARKIKGGPISSSELAGIVNRLEGVGVPSGVEVFDPFIYARVNDQDDGPVPIRVRPHRGATYDDILPFAPVSPHQL